MTGPLCVVCAALVACGARSLDPPYLTDASVCPAGMTACASGCTLTNVDPNNCGACGNACSDGRACVDGSCASACPAGLTLCLQACVGTATDTTNCGACGVHCTAGQACVAGACTYECPPGQTLCGGDAGPVACADLASDTQHCGACGNACPTNHAVSICQHGNCELVACSKGFEDCNADASDGCEIDLQGDSANCGRCGHDCCGGACVSGTCQSVAIWSAPTWTNVGGAIAVDGTDVYWNGSDGVVKCSKTNCTSPTVLASTGSANIAIDSTDVFWDGAVNSAIVRCAKAGCSGTPTVLALWQPAPYAIATDGVDVFWTNTATGASDGSVMSCAVNGCQSSPTVIASAQDVPLSVTVDANFVYWDSADIIFRKFKGGSSPTQIVSGQSPLQLANDGSSLFWSNMKDGAVKTCVGSNNCLATLVILATGLGNVGHLAVDSSNVYWGDFDFASAVVSCAKQGCGGLPTKLADASETAGIAVDDACVYWINGGDKKVMKVAKP